MAGHSPIRSAGGPAHQMLGIYLNDHLAGATAGVELARRMKQEHRDTAYGGDLESLATEISLDRQALVQLMAALDVPVRRYKLCGAWVAEKVGRLKPNGRVRRRPGLSFVVELEALRLGVQGKSLLWGALLVAAAQDSRLDADRLQSLREGAHQQIQVLGSLHERAATALLSPGSPGGTDAETVQ